MTRLKQLATLAICNALSPLALQIMVPALPAIQRDFHASLSQTQMVLAAFSAVLAFAMLVYGPLADRFDRKHLLIAGMGIFSIGSLVGACANSLAIVVAARALQALGAGAASTVTRAIVADIFQGSELNRALSAMMMIVVIGPMLAPILGGFLVDHYSWNYIFSVLLAMGMLLAVMAALLVTTVSSATPVAAPAAGYWRGVREILANRAFLLNMLVLVSVQIGVYAYIATSPFLFIDGLHYSGAQFGLVFVYLTLGYMSGNIISGFVVSSIGAERLIFLAVLVYVIGAALLLLAAHFKPADAIGVAGPAFLLTFANGITQPNCGAGALASASVRRGTAASLSGFGQIMAGAVGFQLAGVLQIRTPTALALLVLLCAAVALGAAAVLAGRPLTREPGKSR